MAKRKSNKQVKAMLMPLVKSASGATCVWWSDHHLCGQFYDPDEYCSYDDRKIHLGTVSIKANR